MPNPAVEQTCAKSRAGSSLPRWAAPSLQSAGRTRCLQSLWAVQAQSQQRMQSAAWPSQVPPYAAAALHRRGRRRDNHSTGTFRALLPFRTIHRSCRGAGIPSLPFQSSPGVSRPTFQSTRPPAGVALPPALCVFHCPAPRLIYEPRNAENRRH